MEKREGGGGRVREREKGEGGRERGGERERRGRGRRGSQNGIPVSTVFRER